MFTKLLAAILAAVCFIAPATVNAADINVAALPYENLGTHVGAQPQTLDDFVLEVRPLLVAYSKQTGFEACGAIAANADKSQYGIVIGTNHSHLGCVIYPDRVPTGMTYIGLTIHSHGLDRMFTLNRADRIFTHNTGDPSPIRCGGDNLYGFSETDFAGGPGFLATPKGVLFQRGEGTTENVAPAVAIAANP